MDIKRLYGYSVQDLATGIVLADSVEDAREKVKAAYRTHCNEFNPETDWVEVWKMDENAWFEDHPDIIKCRSELRGLLSKDDIEIFNAYLEDNDLPIAFGNSDFVRIYKRIVGDLKCSDKLESWIKIQ